MSELTPKEQRRMSKIKWRRSSKTGLYFSVFDTKEEAFRCLQEVAKRYQHTGLHDNTIKELCEEYQDKGIMLYPTQTGKWLREVFNITTKYTGYGRPQEKITTTITFDRDLKLNYLDALVNRPDNDINEHKRSWFINTLLMKHCGMDTPEVLVFMDGKRYDPETKQPMDQKVSVLFYEDKKEVQSISFGRLEKQTKQVISLLCRIGEEDGLDKLEQRANALGYFSL